MLFFFQSTPDASSGREPDINRLIDCYSQSLTRLCYLYLKDEQLAQEAVQDTLYRAYQKYHTFQGKSKEKTWITSIAINICKDYMRKPSYREVPSDQVITLSSQREHRSYTDPDSVELLNMVYQASPGIPGGDLNAVLSGFAGKGNRRHPEATFQHGFCAAKAGTRNVKTGTREGYPMSKMNHFKEIVDHNLEQMDLTPEQKKQVREQVMSAPKSSPRKKKRWWAAAFPVIAAALVCAVVIPITYQKSSSFQSIAMDNLMENITPTPPQAQLDSTENSVQIQEDSSQKQETESTQESLESICGEDSQANSDSSTVSSPFIAAMADFSLELFRQSQDTSRNFFRFPLLPLHLL